MTLVLGLLIPLLGTMIGAAFVFLMKDEMSPRLQKTLLVFAGAENGAAGLSLASALAVSIGIAIQNVPEGAIISMPMRTTFQSQHHRFCHRLRPHDGA